MTPLLAAAALLCVKVLVVMAEHAIRLADAETLEALARRGQRGAERAHWFNEHPERLWATTRTLSRLALVGGTLLLTMALPHPAWALAVALPLVFVTSEVVPRALMSARTERLAPALATPLMVLHHAFRPLVWLVLAYSRRLRGRDEDERPAATREDLQRLVDQDSGDSDMAMGEREMIARIFDFSHLTAADSMVPLKEMCAISVDATVREAAALIAKEGYSRLPVYRDRMEDVVGVLHHIDLLRAADAGMSVGRLMRPPLFVPETQEIDDILVILQRRAASAGIVVDEFGKTLGLLTLEDILEEIVGEIDDEFDPNERPWRAAPGGGYLLSARTTPDDLFRLFGVELPLEDDELEDIETLAGFMLARLKHIPQAGERVDLDADCALVVHRANERAIEELHLSGPVRPREA